jgi:hypothetical protein
MKDCGIVKDLLPLVAENMASEESTVFVKRHLETCEGCRNAYEEMKAPVEADPTAPLKTVRKTVKKRGLLIAGLIACLVGAAAAGFLARIMKPTAVHTKEAAFASVTREGPIMVETREDGIYLMNVEIDSETGKAYLIEDDGARIPFEEVQKSLPEDGRLDWRLVLLTDPAVDVMLESSGGEISVSAYTTLYGQWSRSGGESTQTVIPLKDVNAVFFEPYDGTERAVLYQRYGYKPEAGFALPRLVMNYYFLIALIGTAVLGLTWLVLRKLKKRKACSVIGVLLLIAGSFVIAFLAAGFPATTIAPARELAFVIVIAVLLIGAGLCGRKLLKKE